tara:strand:+ start:287 stop:427 length:141 start_codon:yes stop_codon:yes gene_type:complete
MPFLLPSGESVLVGDELGTNVMFHDDALFVGSPAFASDAGAVYVYR